MYNPGNLGSLKMVAPLRLSPCFCAPSLDIAHLCSQQKKTVIWFVSFVWLNETNQMNRINQINKTNQIDLACPTCAGHLSSAVLEWLLRSR
jgi:hypothetical protein